MKKKSASLIRALKLIRIKLFRIHDTPQKIALGLGLGVFCGILPGTGILAALFLAVVLRVNRASALLGSLLTNTWLSFLTFTLAVKAGSAVMHVNWQEVLGNWSRFLKDFHWANLFKLSLLKIILPVIAGYFMLALGLGLVTYLITLLILKIRRVCPRKVAPD